MTKIKLCGMSRREDIEAVNELLPEYMGFVFWDKSKRYVTDDVARKLKQMLDKRVLAVGVFLDDDIKHIKKLCEDDVIDIIQLHGHEDEGYIKRLREVTKEPIIQAFLIREKGDIKLAQAAASDYVLLDSGAGSGEVLDWSMLNVFHREYFLAGGLNVKNVASAIEKLHPFAVDVSSGIETDGLKDVRKMKEFVEAVRN